MQRMILTSSPDFETINIPTHKTRLVIHNIVTSQAFDTIIMLCIILNMIQMAMTYETASYSYLRALEIANYTFTAVFSAEAFLKIIAFGPRYFNLSWNKFDFFVVITSLLDIILNLLNNLNSRFLRMGP